jgi:hypothetical protein
VTGTHCNPQPQHYKIYVRGRLGETIRSAFPTLQIRTQGDDTMLTGVLADQAALYGVLAELEALGLELIELRRLPPHRPTKRSSLFPLSKTQLAYLQDDEMRAPLEATGTNLAPYGVLGWLQCAAAHSRHSG